MTEFLASGDAVAVFGRYSATVRATGVRVDTPVGHYFKFRDGKIVRYVNLINTAAFVEAQRPVAVNAR
jgi:ketosteroid isomerase-like protein